MGTTAIHDDVFREIVRRVLEEMTEVYFYEPKGPLAPFLADKTVKPSIVIQRITEETDQPNDLINESHDMIAFEIKVAILYGSPIPQTVAKIRQEVATRIAKYTGYTTERVDVYITRLIRFENERSDLKNESKTPSDHQDDGGCQPGDGEQTTHCD
jgi:uncharacterized alkaline shock family protein YloU